MSSSSSAKKKIRRKKKLSMYEEIQRNDRMKWKEDYIYMMLMNPDTTAIDNEIKNWRNKELKNYANTLSDRFKRNTKRAIEDKQKFIRTAKHGLLFLYIWLDPEYAQSLIASPKPRVNPSKFKVFYEEKLDVCCRDLLNTSTTTFQAFVERVRSEYFKL